MSEREATDLHGAGMADQPEAGVFAKWLEPVTHAPWRVRRWLERRGRCGICAHRVDGGLHVFGLLLCDRPAGARRGRYIRELSRGYPGAKR